jgi:hypothetical protein
MSNTVRSKQSKGKDLRALQVNMQDHTILLQESIKRVDLVPIFNKLMGPPGIEPGTYRL